jgi:hypothetical protein
MPEPSFTRPDWSWRGARLLLLLFVLSLPAVTPRIYASDEVQYYSYLRSLWFDHDVAFENEYRYFYEAGIARTEGFRETFLERVTETGRRINFGTIGCALLWAPFYALGDITARALHGLGYQVAVDGFSKPYVAAVAYGSAVYGLLSLVLATTMVRWLTRAWGALAGHGSAAALAIWLGTPLLFYMYVAPPMSHATSAFAVSLFLLTWLMVRERWSARGLVALGALAALMTMVREQDAFFVAAPAVDFALMCWRHPGERGRLLLAATAGTAAAVLCFLPQALAYLALNGRIGPSRLVARKMTWTSPHALEVLAAPAHGFFIWTPLAGLALLGLFVLWRRTGPDVRPVVIGLAAAVAVQVYVGGSVESWTVAGAFGQRRFVALTPILVCGLAAVLAVAAPKPTARRVLWVAIALAVWWNIALMLQFGAGLMNRQRLEPGRIAYNSFVVVPRELPALAWRYVFDRASFYESARQLRAE